MPTFKLTLQYDGTRYAGWQRQTSRGGAPRQSPRLKTVQEELEKAMERVVGHKVCAESSGRTDSGVHAVAQAVHCSTTSKIPAVPLRNALNRFLPQDISVTASESVASGFHARFCARSKTYHYVILPQTERSVFLKRYVCLTKYDLSVRLMRRSATCLVGKHDFSSFQASDRSARKSTAEVMKIKVRESLGSDILPFLKGVRLITIEIQARGFVRGMVRNIAGTLIEVGRGKLAAGDVKDILEKRDRRFAGPCAPPQGLYLTEVCYGKD
ncbi:MAG: tRNA pseudouridine(38-40) synthase TruA [Candidatus Omnitrophota bacterium]